MSNDLKVKKDAAISALFALYKASNDASAAVLELVNTLEDGGHDVEDLKAAALQGTFAGGETVAKKTRATKSSAASDAKDSVGEDGVRSDGEEPKKRKKAPKDPNMPKRPLNAYMRFRNDEYKRVTRERKESGEPDLSRTELSDLVKKNWDDLPEVDRSKLQQDSKAELDAYHSRMADYKNEHPPKHAQADEPLSQEPQLEEPAAPETESAASASEALPSDSGAADAESSTTAETDGSGSKKRKKSGDKKEKKEKKEKKPKSE